MLLNNPVGHDGRVIRVIRSLSRDNRVDLYYVNGYADDKKLFNDNVRLISFSQSTPSLWRKVIQNSFFYLEFNFFAKEVLKGGCKYDIVYANDLPTLYPAVQLKKKMNLKLIYDSHEIYTETVNQFFPSNVNFLKKIVFHILIKFMQMVGRLVERKMLKSVDEMITVNKSLASYFEGKYGVKNIAVVMNCPALSKGESFSGVNFREKFGWIGEDKVFIYQGLLNLGRGLDLLFEAMSKTPKYIKLVVVGAGVLENELKIQVNSLKLNDRVKFEGKVDQKDLENYTKGADFGVVLIENLNLSKKLASANKFFEYINSGIPVVCSKQPEHEKIIKKYKVGIMTENKICAIAQAMTLLADSEHIKEFKENCSQASKEYNWENQEKVLLDVVN